MGEQPVIVGTRCPQHRTIKEDGLPAVAFRCYRRRILVAAAEVAAGALEVSVEDADTGVRVHPGCPLAAKPRVHSRIDDALEIGPDSLHRALRDTDIFLHE